MSAEGDGACTAVDVDTLRHHNETKGGFHWKGRARAEEFAGDTTPVPGIDAGKGRRHAPGMDSPMQTLVLHGRWG